MVCLRATLRARDVDPVAWTSALARVILVYLTQIPGKRPKTPSKYRHSDDRPLQPIATLEAPRKHPGSVFHVTRSGLRSTLIDFE